MLENNLYVQCLCFTDPKYDSGSNVREQNKKRAMWIIVKIYNLEKSEERGYRYFIDQYPFLSLVMTVVIPNVEQIWGDTPEGYAYHYISLSSLCQIRTLQGPMPASSFLMQRISLSPSLSPINSFIKMWFICYEIPPVKCAIQCFQYIYRIEQPSPLSKNVLITHKKYSLHIRNQF